MKSAARVAWFLLVVAVGAFAGRALAEVGPGGRAAGRVDVPPALEPWKGFALHGATARLCPPDGTDPATRLCLFPTSLSLDLDGSGAAFTLRARLFDESAVPLPGGEGVFVEEVSVGGKPVPVASRNGLPVVWLPAGSHVLSGRLGWKVMPATLSVPPDVGAVRILRKGVEAEAVLSPAGELRLDVGDKAPPVENRETVKVFRLVADGVPVTVSSLFRLDVSGLARTVTLAGAVPAGAVPLAVRSPVPATFGPDGALVLDAGPGRYEVEIVSRFAERLDRLGPAACPYGPEIWSFREAVAVRGVRPEGMASIDPQTVDVPGPWKALPAFWARPGETLALRETGRGIPAGRDALTLSREMWLDFSGQGLSVRDTLAGENRERFTLRMLAPGVLGRVTVSGRDQPVVLLGEDGGAGVELRRSRLDVVARLRYPDVAAPLPVAGFDREFERVSASLRLPPGWGLIAAAGPDEVSGGLFSDWTLLDCFLAFVLAVGAFSLRGPAAAAALGCFLLLAWNEPGAPTLAWAFVLASLGLLRAAGEPGRLAGRPALRRFALAFFVLSCITLAVRSVPFVSEQLRQAVAPQIRAPSPAPLPAPARLAARKDAAPRPAAQAPAPPPAPGGEAAEAAFLAGAPERPVREAGLEFDPGALIQTGPAMPSWSFETVTLGWKGPVVAGQTFRLFLLPPAGSLLLGISRVLLLGLALFLLFDRERALRLARPAGAAVLLAALLGLASPAAAADFPSRDLLDTLRDRLTEPAACFPHCLGSPGLSVHLENGRLRLVCEVDAAAGAAVPLPAVDGGWRPSRVLLDGSEAVALTRQGGAPRLLVEAGRHVVTLEGPVPRAVSFSITPALAPGRVRVAAPGYRVRGIDARGMLRGALELTRAGDDGRPAAHGDGPVLAVPAFFEVSRRLDFGLSFEVATEVVRRSPSDVPAVATVPLLPGEMPAASGVTVREGVAEVSFAPGQERLGWRSRLPAVPELVLAAPREAGLIETWTVSAAPFYDLAFEGLPPSARLAADGGWQPRFSPWPGETLVIRLSRPAAAPGEHLTLERARINARQGVLTRDTELSMTFRAARGVRHVVALPPGAQVTRLTVAGRETSPGDAPGEAGFSLAPGVTEVALHFREKTPLGLVTRTPALDLGLPAANVESRLEFPRDRWLLAVRGATPLGPAVLYWGWLAVVVAIGLGLSCIRETPLSRRGWLAYSVGLSQATPVNFVLATAWLLALGLRRRHAVSGNAAFNAAQVFLVLLSLAGLAALYDTLDAGLLGLPRMQVAGGGSTATVLVWTFDRVAGPVPLSTAVTAPMAVFRGLMLAWAAWLAWSLARWLRWGFECLTEGGGWRKVGFVIRLPGRGRGTKSDGGDARDEGASRS